MIHFFNKLKYLASLIEITNEISISIAHLFEENILGINSFEMAHHMEKH